MMHALANHVQQQKEQQLFSSVHTVEGDAFHPPCNIEKMKRGEPLNDQDRMPWLQSINDHFSSLLLSHQSLEKKGILIVAAVSALKKQYRQVLARNLNTCQVWFVHLKASFSVIHGRVSDRSTKTQHFMPVKLLESQFEALEEEADDEEQEAEEASYRVMIMPFTHETTTQEMVHKVEQRILFSHEQS